MSCSRLGEVRLTLEQGHWPAACAAELRAHVEGCRRCGEEVLLATHFQAARNEAVAVARVEPASLVWWRAQLRRRDAVLKRAGRPLAAAQVFALVVVLAAMIGAIAVKWQGVVAGVASIATLRGDWGVAPLVVGLGVLTMLCGVVVYLTAERQ
jgi:anti-sigma factor RsiW